MTAWVFRAWNSPAQAASVSSDGFQAQPLTH
jgi:hypothetical protein